MLPVIINSDKSSLSQSAAAVGNRSGVGRRAYKIVHRQTHAVDLNEVAGLVTTCRLVAAQQ